MPVRQRLAVAAAAVAGGVTALALAAAPAVQASTAIVPYLSHFSSLKTIASTVPANGDVNPYGIFVITRSTGDLHAGNVLVSNFNNKANQQGTGHTIVQITPSGHRSVFANIRPAQVPACPGGVGLTTALEVLPGGWVVAGSVPSSNGMAATAKAGCLIVLNHDGQVREVFAGHGINGPWDSAAVVYGQVADLFVTNVLNGTVAAHGHVVHGGTVLRISLALHLHARPSWISDTTIGSGYAERTNAAAFILAQTGVGLGPDGVLYVAETDTSRIFAIVDATSRTGSSGPGFLLTHGGRLNMPLGLAIAPNGDILTVNGGNGRIVETTPGGAQVFARFLDTSGTPRGAGALFGLAVRPVTGGVYYVDDATNTLRLLH